MRLASNKRVYFWLRWAALLGGVAVCAAALARDGARLPWLDVLVLTAVGAWLQRHTIILRRASDGAPELAHSLGDSLCVVALLRDGPVAALMVCFLTRAFVPIKNWKSVRHRSRATRREVLLIALSDLASGPALYWAGGCLYQAMGGHRLLTPDDCARFFHDPRTVLLPLLALLFLLNEVGQRLWSAALLALRGMPQSLRMLRDPMFSLMMYLEALVGVLLLVLWTAWGWATAPYLFFMTEALLLSARSYFERLDVQRSAECDPLTGLASWRGMDSFLRQRLRLTHARHAPLALLFIDADGLKQVNDRYGHAAGDELLKLIGDTCRLHTRERDLVGRRGGDEFLVALEGMDRPEAEKMMGRLQQAVADAVAVHPIFSQTPAGISVGLAMFPTDAQNIQALIETADREMYKDKHSRKAVPVAA